MTRHFAVWLLWLGAACSAAPAAPGPSKAAAQHASRELPVRITFEPALAEPGWLVVEHESGAHERLRTSRTGVELHLPPGPASLRLEVGERTWQLPVVVGPAGEDLVWVVQP